MQISFLGILAAFCMAIVAHSALGQTVTTAAPPTAASDAGAPVPAQAAPASVPSQNGAASRVIIRGWEVQSVSGVTLPALTELDPEYSQGHRAGNARKAAQPSKGKFLVVAVKCGWATGQPPNEPLWVGKPDLTLVDDIGFEYPAVDAVAKNGTDYVPTGLVVSAKHERRGSVQGRTSVNLVYFDVPTTSAAYWVRFNEAGPSIAVVSVLGLP